MGRHQLEVWLDKVFDFSHRVQALPDGRDFARIPAKTIFDAVFLGSACQCGPLHRIEAECREGVLRSRIGALSEEAMGYGLERQDPAAIFDLGCAIARQLKRNGVLASTWSRGLVVAAIDGIEICSSYVRCCPDCMERKVEHKVEGELRKDIQYYHRLCLLTIVSSGFPIPLGIRFQKNGETEVACSLALLQQLVERLGRRFLDVLVADAIYLQTPCVSALEALGLNWVITLKENQPDLLAEAQRLTAAQAPYPAAADQSDELQLWYAPHLDWPVADRDIHVVKTLRRHPRNRQRVQHDSTEPKRIVKATTIEQSTNFYASNLELGSIPPLFLSQLGRSRWQIDADVFQTITTDSSLKQPSLHQGYEKALLVLTMIRVLAFTLTQVFYHRQVRSHFRKSGFGFRDLARRIGYQFLVTSLTFNST